MEGSLQDFFDCAASQKTNIVYSEALTSFPSIYEVEFLSFRKNSIFLCSFTTIIILYHEVRVDFYPVNV